VRSIAGAIIQRSAEQPGIHGSAQAILAMTGHMQDGVHAILQRLRSDARRAAHERIEEALRELLRAVGEPSRRRHPCAATIEPLGEHVTTASA
jgi:two-component system sensor histidine kinase UhpB